MFRNACASVSSLSLEMLPGREEGGDCASLLSALLGETEDAWQILFDSVFTGLDLALLG